MAEYLGLHAIGWHLMIRTWWEKVLASLLLGTLVLGVLFLLYLLWRKVKKHWKSRHQLSLPPKPVTRYFEDLRVRVQQLHPLRASPKHPKSFGVFLGAFSNPPTASQRQLVSQWDLLILDPAQAGVKDVISSQHLSTHIVGRLDVNMTVRRDTKSSNNGIVPSLDRVVRAFMATFKRPQDTHSPFSGVLLADWQAHFRPVIFNELIRFIRGTGFAVYLEISDPDFIPEKQSRAIDMGLISGVVCRNGTILPSGESRNYFQMGDERPALRALAAHQSMTPSIVMMWEIFDENVDHAVIKRSFDWCRFNSVISWIGPRAALTDAEVAATSTVTGEPLGALMWLKGDGVIESHDTWRTNVKISQEPCGDHAIYDSLQSFIPDLADKLALLPPSKRTRTEREGTVIEDLQWPSSIQQEETHPFSMSSRGQNYRSLGCFSLGIDCSANDFTGLVEGQRRLRDLNLLKAVTAEELRRIGGQLLALDEEDPSEVPRSIQELLDLLIPDDEEPPQLRIWIGLHSGFRTITGAQFWGLYDIDESGVTDLYISGFAEDVPGTILHTFLSSRGCPRAQCFMAEYVLHERCDSLADTWELPPRMVKDIEQLSPTESMLLLRRLALFDNREWASISAKVRACCEFQLLDVPEVTQLRALNATSYLRGQVSAEDLVTSRLDWYRERGCHSPNPVAAISLFLEIDSLLPLILLERKSDILTQLEMILHTVLHKKQIDAAADIFALAVFCAFRKLALNEVYMEILDRNPLPNAHPDQAACFAEMFALGSRCESYFDMTPTVIGKLLAERYQTYFKNHQPPQRDDSTTELPTAYASKQVDTDPNAGREKPPVYYEITFLGIFAVPALIDILLLTTIGRGLYVTAFMTEDEKTMATSALMVALLFCGAIGTWISSGGSYYLHSMAFAAMNMFVLTRLIAGIAITLAGGIMAMVVIGVIKGFYAGVIFFLYFFFLTTYLSLLATLAIYQMPGFMFQSGRIIVITCVPLLLISPVVTLWVHHDIVVYLCVLGGFLTSLLLGARRVIAQWATWYLNIPCVTDTEVVDWYSKACISCESEKGTGLPEGTDLAATPLPRKALLEAVLQERNRRLWSKKTTDEFVLNLAEGYQSTVFLMDWYCRYSRTPTPYMYSPTWNLQCKAAVDTLRDMQKGLKLHNAFLHWRYAGPEVWCGVLYFVIALLDKWVALVTGGSVVGLSTDSETFRLAVGFGLAYYLVGAVFLDAVAQPLWALAHKKEPTPVTSLALLRQVAMKDAQARRTLYWTNLVKFFFLHVWGIAFTSALMWVFEEARPATIMYMSYVGAYSGLLWYQYNRIFTGPLVLKDLLMAAIIGLVSGVILRKTIPTFPWSNVISLAVGTWTAAMLSLRTSKIIPPGIKEEMFTQDKHSPTPNFYSNSGLGPYPELSQATMSKIFDSCTTLPAETRFRVFPSEHPGNEVMHILSTQGRSSKSQLVHTAFPVSEQMIHRTAELWRMGEVVVQLVPQRHLFDQERKLRSVSRVLENKLHIFVFLGLDLVGNEWKMDIRRNCKVIAEAIVQATAESRFGFSHDHSMLAEMTVSNYAVNNISLPEGIIRQLETSPAERERIIKSADQEMLRYLLLGINCDKDWDNLPLFVRTFLLERCYGKPCRASAAQLDWIRSKFCQQGSLTVEEVVARSNLGGILTLLAASFAESIEADCTHLNPLEAPDSSYEKYIDTTLLSIKNDPDRRLIDVIKGPIMQFFNGVRVSIKFVVISIVADPEFQRELDYLVFEKPWLIRSFATCTLNAVWLFCKTLQRIVLPFFLFHKRERVSKLYNNMKGMKTVLEKNRIVIESLSGPSTSFFTTDSDGTSQLHQYSGLHAKKPEGLDKLMAVNTYADGLVLQRREEWAWSAIVNAFTYDYAQNDQRSGPRLPIQRQCVAGTLSRQIVQYDDRAYITSGSTVKDENPVEYKYWYRKHARFDDELLRAEFVLPHIRIKVIWSVRPPNREKEDKWIPHAKVTEAKFTEGSTVYYSKWDYDHKYHPVITTTLNGEPVATPPMIEHDWFNVLKKPVNCSFLNDNPLFGFKSVKTSFLSRLLGFNAHRYAVSTARARTYLWKSWKDGKDLDAVTTRWLDEIAMRSDKILRSYWRKRDTGRIRAAVDYLDAQVDTIMARVDVDPEVSSWTPLAFKISDLYSFGQGGDTRINTRSVSTQLFKDSESTLHVLAMDTGTWPNEGGGVSACRRDMVNDLKTIRWHVVAESANDFGVPKFQIERNVQSLTVLPLWGLDFLTPTHGVFQDLLDTEVQQRSNNTSTRDIKRKFIPILKSLVRCARAIDLTHEHIEEAGKALVDLNNYFESSRHWSDVWMSDTVKKAWRELWLCEDMDNATPVSRWLEAQRPTLSHLDQALDMWHRYLFIFSIPVPEKIPDIFQASHHFTGASFGVLCKLKRQCALHVWDHCISWREVTVFLSSAMSFDAPFVCTSLMSISRLASVLILHHADVVLPCADFFNPGWEVEIGTQEGTLEHRNTFKRKIDPVVNGICNMERFKPIEKIKTTVPTAVMLSHVRFVKDIKNALLAADIIVNEWGFKSYRLDIYGDMEKAPAYSVECKEILASKGLRDNVVLRGLGSPFKVLEDAWLFLNSSVSEGLPLAMGEAALTGVPVVCTDVGASFRVVTDMATGKRFSPCVAPNDAYSLARAQINVLAMLDEWSEFADDAPGYRPKLSLNPTAEEVEMVTKRMYEKTEQRRRLGMLGRANVQTSFSQERYLREHEQMLWIGKHQSQSYNGRISRPASSTLTINRSSMFQRPEEEVRLIEDEAFSHLESSNSSLFRRTEPEEVVEVV